ncbi:MAG: 4'-phosphopantetheinyl transferase family protein [Ostreibacterium sp.]
MSFYIYITTQQAYHEGLLSYLNTLDKTRANSITNLNRQQAFIIGRSLICHAVRELTGCSNYQLQYNELGKPELVLSACDDIWHINLSHSGQHICLAIQKNHPIGIDIELIKPRKINLLVNRLFSPKQVQFIQSAQDPTTMFYYFWTQYEAQIKLVGKSVFSNLPSAEGLWLASYHQSKTAISLCSSHTPNQIIFYQITSLLNGSKTTIFPQKINLKLY